MKVEPLQADTPATGRSDLSDLMDKVIGSMCFAAGFGLLLWTGFGLFG